MSPSRCVACGAELKPKGRGRPPKFCDRQCKEDDRTARKRVDRDARVGARHCVQCRAPIPLAMKSNAVTCSRKCGIDYQNARKVAAAHDAAVANRGPCPECGKPVPHNRRAGAEFCSWRCKKIAISRRNHEPVHWQKYMRQYKYGLTPEAFDALMAAQGGVCAVCGSPEWNGKGDGPHVDHDHSSGRVRGLLCRGCNNGLGHFKDDPDRLIAAAAYLRKHQAAVESIA